MRLIFILAFILISVVVFAIFGISSMFHTADVTGDWLYGNAKLTLNNDGTGVMVYMAGDKKYTVDASWEKTSMADVYKIVIMNSKIPSDNYKYQDGYLIGSSATLVRG
jgi:hypothetical protein